MDITRIEANIAQGMDVDCRITRADGSTEDIKMTYPGSIRSMQSGTTTMTEFS